MPFRDFFVRATGLEPFPYQVRLAETDRFADLVQIPTGGGKTAFAVLAWLWRRRYASPEIRANTPRRLIYCLPVRTLVDQTTRVVEAWLNNLQLDPQVSLHAMMGGAIDEEWESYPEREAILVGTQDQLLSRALNRGYSMSRYRWPVHFGLLNNDVLWILDETQLMGVGLSTSTQLQAFRNTFGTHGPARSLWMSATLDRRMLATIDFRNEPLLLEGLADADKRDGRLIRRLHAVKRLHKAASSVANDGKSHATSLAREIVDSHQPGTITLAIVNRVARAQQLYSALQQIESAIPLELIHSRFRPADRTARQNEVLSGGWAGIVVATQAIEAGVDISARTLFTELAPWSSLVQRFGRCNRAGEFDAANVYWVDVANDEKLARPYDVAALKSARLRIETLSDVGIEQLPEIREENTAPSGPVIRKREFLELFDTQPDLSGCDVDVSRYIRATDERDVQVHWRTWDDVNGPLHEQPHRDELCNAPCWDVAEILKRARNGVYRWNGMQQQWERPQRIVPGMQILLHSSVGGYDVEMGWLPSSTRPVEPVIRPHVQQDADESEERGTLNSRFMSIEEHTREVVEELETILASVSEDVPGRSLRTAALWHDVGKAHPVFQELLLNDIAADDPMRQNGPFAKSPSGKGGRIARRYFRHELVSCLALLACGGSDLDAYLVAAHHGKVRMSMRSRPGEPPGPNGSRTVLGVQHGDLIGPVHFDDVHLPATVLDLSITELGEHNGSKSWLARTLELLDTHGPFRIAYLEAVLRAADWRASAHVTGNSLIEAS